MTRRLAALVVLASSVAAAFVVVPTMGDEPPATAEAAVTPTLQVMGEPILTAADLVRYYNSVSHLPYRVVSINPFANPPTVTPVPIETIANAFIDEGRRYNVRGDVAFAQSLVETAWFNYPDYGQVRPWNFNFAGIGACDSCNNGYQFPSAIEGVRAQIQLLRNYADSTSRTTNIPDPPLPSLWGSNPTTAAFNFNNFSHKGRAPYWIKPDCSSGCMGNGNWATSPAYSTTVTTVYRQMLSFFGRTIAPESIGERYANLDADARQALGNPLAEKETIPGGEVRRYQGGAIYWTSDLGAHEVYGAIYLKYLGMGGPSGVLGFPVTGEGPAEGGGRVSYFAAGVIAWTSDTGAHEVHGANAFLYGLMGGPGSVLGYPLTDEAATPGGAGRYNDFQGGSIYWSAATGVNEVHGALAFLYGGLGGPASVLGLPTSSVQAVPGGWKSSFQNGAIYSSPSTGTYEVHGAIAFVYGLTGGPAGPYGLPTSNEIATPGGTGRYNDFQRGSIFSSAAGIAGVSGSFANVYGALGGPTGILGFPVAGERGVAGGASQNFQNGALFGSPWTGVHEVHGPIAFLYGLYGGPNSFLGFPYTDETSTALNTGRYNLFQGGSIYYTPATGPHEIHGPIRDYWAATGWEMGPFGYPVSDEFQDGIGRTSLFEHGSVSWLPFLGAFRSS